MKKNKKKIIAVCLAGAILSSTMIVNAATETGKRMYGDVDQNGRVDLSDLITMCRYAIKDIEFDEETLQVADVTKDGEVNVGDIALLKQYLMGDSIPIIGSLLESEETTQEVTTVSETIIEETSITEVSETSVETTVTEVTSGNIFETILTTDSFPPASYFDEHNIYDNSNIPDNSTMIACNCAIVGTPNSWGGATLKQGTYTFRQPADTNIKSIDVLLVNIKTEAGTEFIIDETDYAPNSIDADGNVVSKFKVNFYIANDSIDGYTAEFGPITNSVQFNKTKIWTKSYKEKLEGTSEAVIEGEPNNIEPIPYVNLFGLGETEIEFLDTCIFTGSIFATQSSLTFENALQINKDIIYKRGTDEIVVTKPKISLIGSAIVGDIKEMQDDAAIFVVSSNGNKATTTTPITTKITTTTPVTTTTKPQTTTTVTTTSAPPVTTTVQTTPVDMSSWGLSLEDIQGAVSYINEIRAKKGLYEYKTDLRLCNIANIKSGELQRDFTSNRPDGSSYKTLYDEYAINYNIKGYIIMEDYGSYKSAIDYVSDYRTISSDYLNILG